jgi:hypothetical protein
MSFPRQRWASRAWSELRRRAGSRRRTPHVLRAGNTLSIRVVKPPSRGLQVRDESLRALGRGLLFAGDPDDGTKFFLESVRAGTTTPIRLSLAWRWLSRSDSSLPGERSLPGLGKALGSLDPLGSTHERLEEFLEHLASERHPNVIAMHEAGVLPTTGWCDMDLIQERSLRDVLNEEGPIPPARPLVLADAMASGLQALHVGGSRTATSSPRRSCRNPTGRRS